MRDEYVDAAQARGRGRRLRRRAARRQRLPAAPVPHREHEPAHRRVRHATSTDGSASSSRSSRRSPRRSAPSAPRSASPPATRSTASTRPTRAGPTTRCCGELATHDLLYVHVMETESHAGYSTARDRRASSTPARWMANEGFTEEFAVEDANRVRRRGQGRSRRLRPSLPREPGPARPAAGGRRAHRTDQTTFYRAAPRDTRTTRRSTRLRPRSEPTARGSASNGDVDPGADRLPGPGPRVDRVQSQLELAATRAGERAATRLGQPQTDGAQVAGRGLEPESCDADFEPVGRRRVNVARRVFEPVSDG